MRDRRLFCSSLTAGRPARSHDDCILYWPVSVHVAVCHCRRKSIAFSGPRHKHLANACVCTLHFARQNLPHHSPPLSADSHIHKSEHAVCRTNCEMLVVTGLVIDGSWWFNSVVDTERPNFTAVDNDSSVSLIAVVLSAKHIILFLYSRSLSKTDLQWFLILYAYAVRVRAGSRSIVWRMLVTVLRYHCVIYRGCWSLCLAWMWVCSHVYKGYMKQAFHSGLFVKSLVSSLANGFAIKTSRGISVTDRMQNKTM